jgi:hypothetical protein
MGLRDWLNKGKKAAAENKDAVKDGVDKAGDFIDEKTDGAKRLFRGRRSNRYW